MFVFRKNSILNLLLAEEMSRSFGGLYFTLPNLVTSAEENNVSSANAVPQSVVSIQFVDEGDVTEVF